MLLGDRMTALGFYVHIPFCASRCGYCDFNTYTAEELIADGSSVTRSTYVDRAIAEIRMARAALEDERSVSTVFFGGGTPTLLDPSDLVRVLDVIRQEFGLADDAEITTEANPDSVDPASLQTLRDGGFNRISLGHQSSAQHVLKVLDRTHTPGRSLQSVDEARAAGFEHVNLDLIYGTPGERDDDLRRTLDDVLSTQVDHVSAYSLIVEPGTRLAAQVGRGEVPMPDDDTAASRYELIDSTLSAAGLGWYEVSNWARPGSECRHNLAYWRTDDWWGVGPGAHSHVAGQRWWNIKHPAAYAAKIDAGTSPEAERETVDEQTRYTEEVMLRLRLREGLSLERLDESGRAAALTLRETGLLEATEWAAGRAVLTARGRLLADRVVRDLLT
jgi:putative oxygen-independent coproporphyrinogen III oxidase